MSRKRREDADRSRSRRNRVWVGVIVLGCKQARRRELLSELFNH